ncbi:MAG: hypothetical protein KGN98_08770 [Alphaproteobacteria bacterium]|nr:hypothetical protein [Alphaproteobacteria bacterium]
MTTNRTILEAIATKRCLTASYNGTAFLLAPHILYTRIDLVYLDAVPITKNGAPPREVKMATFKVDGMSDIALADDEFELSPLYEPWQEKYRDKTLFSVPE